MNESLTRTVCIKLDVAGNKAVLTETQHRFNEAACWVASLCWEEHITNTNTAHHRVYGESRMRLGTRRAIGDLCPREGDGGHQGREGAGYGKAGSLA